MNLSKDDDWLDMILSNQADHIDDDGFTDAVINRLPPRRLRRRWLNGVILTGAALVSGTVLLISLPNETVLYTQISALLLSQPIIGVGVFSLILSVVAGLMAGWMLSPKR